MVDRKRGRLLLTMAQKDFEAIERMANDEAFADEIFGLHAQQAVEKALKAWLCITGARPPRIHDLEELAALLREYDQILPDVIDSLIELTDFAVQFRYEPYANFDEPFERCQIVKDAATLIEYVQAQFGSD